jgi:N-acylneuraminate cytidylyltransferase
MSFFLPVRKGSERVKNKNTRPFANISGGLLENKLQQIIKSDMIDEIIVSTNDKLSIVIAKKYSTECSKIKIIPRPEELCLSTTNLQDLIAYVPTITDAENILWGHVTTPLADEKIYDDAIAEYFNQLPNGFDSLISVTEIKNFILNSSGRIINNNSDMPWPRTQDLEPLYEINHVLFIANRNVYSLQKNRVGNNPYLYTMDKIKSIDVDWEEDFIIAEELYKNRK